VATEAGWQRRQRRNADAERKAKRHQENEASAAAWHHALAMGKSPSRDDVTALVDVRDGWGATTSTVSGAVGETSSKTSSRLNRLERWGLVAHVTDHVNRTRFWHLTWAGKMFTGPTSTA
jgi:hypothetical protein